MKHLRFLSFGKLATACLFSFLSVQSYGQTVSLNTIEEPGSFGDPEINGNSGDACVNNIGSPSTATYSLTLNNGTLNSPTYNWSIKGGFNLNSSSGASATVEPFIDAKGRYNKGRLTVFYKGTVDSSYTVTLTDVCGDGETREEEVTIQVPRSGIAYVDLYQEFNHLETIVGDQCVVSGQSEAYSIKDLVSGNLDQGIGLDDYYWDYNDLVPSVAYHFYESGDKSAQTLIFKEDISSIEGKQMDVIVGKCNTQVTSITFKGELEPQVITPTASCIPTSTSTLELSHPDETGVNYTWKLPPQYTFAASYGPSSNPVVININTSAGEVTLVAEAGPSSDYCTQEPQEITYEVKRSLGATDKITGVSCVEEGTTYQYSITPNPSAAIDWSLPSGWSIVGGAANENASTIEVDVASSAVSGIITASTLGCSGSEIDTNVYVKPDALGSISGDACITYGSTTDLSYSVAAVDNAVSYDWSLPSDWSIASGEGTSSITVSPNGTTVGEISVIAKGGDDCDSEEATLTIEFAPTAPTSVTAGSCINAGSTDLVSFEVDSPVPGATYEWSVPSGSGWTIASYQNIGTAQKARVFMNTDGVEGSYSVPVRAVADCGNSSYYNHPVSITAIDAVIDSIVGFGNIQYAVLDDYQSNSGSPLPFGTTYQWYANSSPIASETNYYIALTVPGASTLGVQISSPGEDCHTWLQVNSSYSHASAMRSADIGTIASATREPYSLSPNPANESFNVNLTTNFTTGSITLRTLNGEVIKRQPLTSKDQSINTSDIPQGIYMVELTLDKKVYTNKILLAH